MDPSSQDQAVLQLAIQCARGFTSDPAVELAERLEVEVAREAGRACGLSWEALREMPDARDHAGFAPAYQSTLRLTLLGLDTAARSDATLWPLVNANKRWRDGGCAQLLADLLGYARHGIFYRPAYGATAESDGVREPKRPRPETVPSSEK